MAALILFSIESSGFDDWSRASLAFDLVKPRLVKASRASLVSGESPTRSRSFKSPSLGFSSMMIFWAFFLPSLGIEVKKSTSAFETAEEIDSEPLSIKAMAILGPMPEMLIIS